MGQWAIGPTDGERMGYSRKSETSQTGPNLGQLANPLALSPNGHKARWRAGRPAGQLANRPLNHSSAQSGRSAVLNFFSPSRGLESELTSFATCMHVP